MLLCGELKKKEVVVGDGFEPSIRITIPKSPIHKFGTMAPPPIPAEINF
jgi:hypothetical protein